MDTPDMPWVFQSLVWYFLFGSAWRDRFGSGWHGRAIMGESVVERSVHVSLGVLVNAVPRDAVDDAVAVCGVREKRSDGKLPAHSRI